MTINDWLHNGNDRTLYLNRLPQELLSYPQFVVWRSEDHGEPKHRKVPINPRTGKPASVRDPRTWGTLDEALHAYNSGKYSGIGFVFTDSDSFLGIDLDKCRNPTTGEIEKWASEYMQRVGGYWEVSPSGTGLHGIIRMTAPLPPHGRKKGNVEMYETARFFTMTGHHVEGTAPDIEDCTSEVLALHAEIFGTPEQRTAKAHPAPVINLSDERLLRVASRAKNGAKFTVLWKGDTTGYASPSQADLALCSLLAFYCGNDPERINRLFRQSALYRKKWEREDYSSETLKAASRSAHSVYGTPKENPKANKAVEALRSLVATFPGKGAVWTSARLVLTALSQMIEQCGKDEISADCRTIAEMTGLTFTTVAKTFRRLCGVAKDKHDHVPVCLTRIVDKTVICTDGLASRHAYKYRLSEGARNAHTHTHLPPRVNECAFSAPCLQTLSHDAFKRRGIGLRRSAGLVLLALPCRTAQEIAERTHLSLRTVRNALASLKAEGLVEKYEKTSEWIRTCETLDAVAERRRTAGEGKKQRERHRMQRDMFSALLSRMRAKRDGTVYKLHKDAPDPVWAGTWRDAA